MTYDVCVDGGYLSSADEDFATIEEAAERAQQVKREYPESVVTILLVAHD